MAFNFNAFLQNFGQVASQTVQTYEQKQEKGQSLHQADYINMGIATVFAALAAIQTEPETPKPPAT